MDKLANTSNESLTIAQPSSLDLVLAQCLDSVSQVYKTEMFPGEVRIWQHVFSKENPKAVAWGFRKYFETGTFPPKPADVAALIRQRRESESSRFTWDDDLMTEEIAARAEDRKLAEESRQQYFASPEYKAFLERMKRERGI